MIIDFYQNNKIEILNNFCKLLNLNLKDLKNEISKTDFEYKLKSAFLKNFYDFDVVLSHVTTINRNIISKYGLVPLNKQLEDVKYPICELFEDYKIKLNFKEKYIQIDDNIFDYKYCVQSNEEIGDYFKELFQEKGSICAFLAGENYEIYNDTQILHEPEIISKINNILIIIKKEKIKWTTNEPLIVYFKTNLKNINDIDKFVESCIQILHNIINGVKSSCVFNDFSLNEDVVICPNQIIKIEKYIKRPLL